MQGSGVDTSLNEMGRSQATAFYEAYKHIPFDRIYTSTLKRTLETVAPFIENGISHHKLADLNEFSWGCREGMPHSEDNHREYLEVTNAWKEGNFDVCIEGGENPLQVKERLTRAIDFIMSQKEEEKILVCMHGRAMRVFLCILLNYDLRCMDHFAHDNTCLYQLAHTGTMFNVIAFNDVAHLCDINSKQFE